MTIPTTHQLHHKIPVFVDAETNDWLASEARRTGRTILAIATDIFVEGCRTRQAQQNVENSPAGDLAA